MRYSPQAFFDACSDLSLDVSSVNRKIGEECYMIIGYDYFILKIVIAFLL
jgi:hypothetical protein